MFGYVEKWHFLKRFGDTSNRVGIPCNCSATCLEAHLQNCQIFRRRLICTVFANNRQNSESIQNMRVKIQSSEVDEDEDDAEYDDDPEEDIEEVSALIGFVGQDKKFQGGRIDISKSVEKDCWPNQRCLSKIIIDRIQYALKNLGKTLKNFEVFDFQIYTANRNILELQTLSRMLEHEGVLPGYILTQSDTDKEKFANIRVQKYVHKPEKDVRLNEIKTKAKNPQCLQLLIFDEAHYGATQQTKEGFRQTPYSSILQHYNSQDYPNVIVLLVTATPWNLLTVCSKLSDSKVMYDPNTGELKSCDNALSAIHTNR